MPTFVINDATLAAEATSGISQTFFLTDNASRSRVSLNHLVSKLINYGTIFDDIGGDAVAGNGVTGMRERARALGGELTVGPGTGGGFRVAARLPIGTGVAS